MSWSGWTSAVARDRARPLGSGRRQVRRGRWRARGEQAAARRSKLILGQDAVASLLPSQVGGRPKRRAGEQRRRSGRPPVAGDDTRSAAPRATVELPIGPTFRPRLIWWLSPPTNTPSRTADWTRKSAGFWWRRGRFELPVQKRANQRSYRLFRRLLLVRKAAAGAPAPDKADGLRRSVSASDRSTRTNRRRSAARPSEACGRRHCVLVTQRGRTEIRLLSFCRQFNEDNGTSACTSDPRFPVEAFRPQCAYIIAGHDSRLPTAPC